MFSAQLYSVKIDEETQTPVPSEEREVPLNLKKHPVSATFGVFDEYVLMFLDDRRKPLFVL